MHRANSLSSIILLLFAVSCIDPDVLNVSDSLEIQSSYSLPIGPLDYDINTYFESLDTVTLPWPDTVSYNDVLYPSYAGAVDITTRNPFIFNIVEDPSAKVKSVELIVIAANGYPTQATVQVYFLAGTPEVPVDSVFSDGPRTLQPAGLNSEGIVADPFTALYNISMSQGFIQNMSVITGVMVKSRIETTRSDIKVVKFYDEYKIDLHLASRIELQFNTGDF
jgi:hypothetical protein